MAALLLDLVNYLAAKSLVAGDGVDAFRDFVPEKPDTVVVLSEYTGDPVSVYTSVVHRSVQVRVRSTSAELARAKCMSICEAFISTSDDNRIDFSTARWGQVYVRQTPFKLSQDESGRTTYCFNLGITTSIE